MRRKKDDKRVLRPGNGRQDSSKRRKLNRQFRSRGQTNDTYLQPPRNPKNRRKKRKASDKTVFLMILALVAFVIGAGIGVTLSFDTGDDGPHFVNVTKEMTTNLNNTTPVIFDDEVDDIDFNENSSSQLNVQYEYSDYTYKDYSEDSEDYGDQ